MIDFYLQQFLDVRRKARQNNQTRPSVWITRVVKLPILLDEKDCTADVNISAAFLME